MGTLRIFFVLVIARLLRQETRFHNSDNKLPGIGNKPGGDPNRVGPRISNKTNGFLFQLYAFKQLLGKTHRFSGRKPESLCCILLQGSSSKWWCRLAQAGFLLYLGNPEIRRLAISFYRINRFLTRKLRFLALDSCKSGLEFGSILFGKHRLDNPVFFGFETRNLPFPFNDNPQGNSLNPACR